MSDSPDHDVLPPAGQESNELAAFSRTEAALAEIRTRAAEHTFDCTTSKGDQEARASRLQLVRLRTGLDESRLSIKRPHLDAIAIIDSEAKRITAEILKVEEPIDRLIKAEETRRAAIVAERDRLERVRVLAQDAGLRAIAMLPIALVGKPAAEIAIAIGDLKAKALDGFHDDYRERATITTRETLGQLEHLHDRAQALESEQRKMAEDRAENQRIADEAAARRAAEEAKLAEQRRLEDEARAARRLLDQRADEIVDSLQRVYHAQAQEPIVADIDRAIAKIEGVVYDEATYGDNTARILTIRGNVLLNLRSLRAAAIADAAERQRLEDEAQRQAARQKEIDDAEAAAELEREHERERAKRRQEAEDLQREHDEAEARAEAEVQRLATTTLENAARDAVELLGELGQGQHIITRTLAAAITRKPIKPTRARKGT